MPTVSGLLIATLSVQTCNQILRARRKIRTYALAVFVVVITNWLMATITSLSHTAYFVVGTVVAYLVIEFRRRR
jgi:hypothetical protein